MVGEQVVRIRREQTGEDRYGNPEYGDVEALLEERAGFDPGGYREPAEVGREPLITSPKLYFWQAAPDLRDDDRVRVRGQEYVITGRPAQWEHMFTGWQAGTVVELERVSG